MLNFLRSKPPVTAKELRYGDSGTVHSTGYVDVEVDESGKVVSVWFRCMQLPFRQRDVDKDRAASMRRVTVLPTLKAVVMDTEKPLESYR